MTQKGALRRERVIKIEVEFNTLPVHLQDLVVGHDQPFRSEILLRTIVRKSDMN
jgi:hypothetical protein